MKVTIVTGASGDREDDDKCSGVDLVISAACSQNYGCVCRGEALRVARPLSRPPAHHHRRPRTRTQLWVLHGREREPRDVVV